MDEQTIQSHKRQEEVEGLRNDIVGINGEMERLQINQRMNERSRRELKL